MGLRTLGVLAVVVLVACATPPPGPMTVESAKFPDVRTRAKREPPKTVRFVLRAVPLSGRSEGGRFRQPPRMSELATHRRRAYPHATPVSAVTTSSPGWGLARRRAR